VAVHDPRYGYLRLLPNHDVFFEFVPIDEVGRDRPTRLEAALVEPNVPYALAMTSPAGVWSCLTGDRVCFESRDPPLLHLLSPVTDEIIRPERSAPAASAHPFPVQPPHHPRNGQPLRGRADRVSGSSR
jgi:hypothetical protein